MLAEASPQPRRDNVHPTRRPHGSLEVAASAGTELATLRVMAGFKASGLAVSNSHVAAALEVSGVGFVQAARATGGARDCMPPPTLQLWRRAGRGLPGKAAASQPASLVVQGVHCALVHAVVLATREDASDAVGLHPAGSCRRQPTWLVSCSLDRVVVWRLDELWQLACRAAHCGPDAEVEGQPAEGVAFIPHGLGSHGRDPVLIPGSSLGGPTCAELVSWEVPKTSNAISSSTTLPALALAARSEGSSVIAAVAHGAMVKVARAEFRSGWDITQLAELPFNVVPRHLLFTGGHAISLPPQRAAACGSGSRIGVGRRKSGPSAPANAAPQHAPHAERHRLVLWVASAGSEPIWSCEVSCPAADAGLRQRPMCVPHSLLAGTAVHCLIASAVAPSRCYVGGDGATVQIVDRQRETSAVDRVHVAPGQVAAVVAMSSLARTGGEETLIVLLESGSIFIQQLSFAGEAVPAGGVSRVLALAAGAPAPGRGEAAAFPAGLRLASALSPASRASAAVYVAWAFSTDGEVHVAEVPDDASRDRARAGSWTTPSGPVGFAAPPAGPAYNRLGATSPAAGGGSAAKPPLRARSPSADGQPGSQRESPGGRAAGAYPASFASCQLPPRGNPQQQHQHAYLVGRPGGLASGVQASPSGTPAMPLAAPGRAGSSWGALTPGCAPLLPRHGSPRTPRLAGGLPLHGASSCYVTAAPEAYTRRSAALVGSRPGSPNARGTPSCPGNLRPSPRPPQADRVAGHAPAMCISCPLIAWPRRTLPR